MATVAVSVTGLEAPPSGALFGTVAAAVLDVPSGTVFGAAAEMVFAAESEIPLPCMASAAIAPKGRTKRHATSIAFLGIDLSKKVFMILNFEVKIAYPILISQV